MKRIILFTILAVLFIVVGNFIYNYFFSFEKLSNKSVLIAQREGVANCMTYMFFLKNNHVVQKEFCFGITSRKGKYINNNGIYKITWRNKNKRYNHKNAIAIIKKYSDRLGQIHKTLNYYIQGDTTDIPMGFIAYDEETKCPDYNTKTDKSDLEFLEKRFSKKEVIEYESKLYSTLSDKNKFKLGSQYFPNNQNIILDDPMIFDRKYEIGIPLKSSYFFSNNKLIVQYYEWSDVGVECLKNFDRNAYTEVYKQLVDKIVKIKGLPNNIIGDFTNKDTTQFETIWDNGIEHLELHLYLYDNFRIRLINYWK